jgi:hypothetical protein
LGHACVMQVIDDHRADDSHGLQPQEAQS